MLLSGKDDPVGRYGKGVKKLEKVYRKFGINNVKTILYHQMRHEILKEENKQIIYDDIIKFMKSN